MKNIISFVNKKNNTLDNRNTSIPGSSSDIIHQRGALNTEDFEEGKKDGVFELGHLEFTTNSAQLVDSDDDNDNAIKVVNAATDEANEANSEEKSMTLRQALRKYPKAALWSILVSTTLVMEGYDTALLSALYALPVFQRKFGTMNAEGSYEISSQWQIGLNMCVLCGEMIGLQITTYMVEFIGNRYTMITALGLLTAYIFILYYCKSLAMIAVGQILSAMPWGCFQSLAVTYASEVCPLALRYYMTSYSNICWLFGQIFASGIMKNSQENLGDSDLGYKLPFALQWIWPAPLIVGIFFAPESPWWLVRKNKIAEAKKSLNRILSGTAAEKEIQVDITLKQIEMTIEKERLLASKSGSFFNCFKGVDGRRTRLACLTWVAQNSSGAVLLGYSTYFFERAGMATDKAFTFSLIQYCLGLAGTLCSWVISGRVGRWTILTYGLAFQMVCLFIIGGMGFASGSNASNGAGGLLLALSFFYNAGIGAVVYCIVAEIPSAELRTKTIVLARICYNLMAVINAILTPYMLNVSDWNWGAKTGLYWGGFTAVTLAWVIIDLPETTGRTFSEINELFNQGVPARKFASTVVDPFERKESQIDPQVDGVINQSSSAMQHGLNEVNEF
ncbi:alpha-glucoside permease [Saccharomyces paradoxus]|uniref:Alpha-glucoside permease n=1 Tax=Saccharomyces paradoxus TaxID=27291 RepID=A0A8B8US73_SACPA|nr:Mal11 [Saccharomyces paradoxus]QHS73585.1 Mal11 [Saccharomyces paradoxus]